MIPTRLHRSRGVHTSADLLRSESAAMTPSRLRRSRGVRTFADLLNDESVAHVLARFLRSRGVHFSQTFSSVGRLLVCLPASVGRGGPDMPHISAAGSFVLLRRYQYSVKNKSVYPLLCGIGLRLAPGSALCNTTRLPVQTPLRTRADRAKKCTLEASPTRVRSSAAGPPTGGSGFPAWAVRLFGGPPTGERRNGDADRAPNSKEINDLRVVQTGAPQVTYFRSMTVQRTARIIAFTGRWAYESGRFPCAEIVPTGSRRPHNRDSLARGGYRAMPNTRLSFCATSVYRRMCGVG